MASQVVTGDDAIDQIEGGAPNEDTRSGPLSAEELRRAAAITNSSRPGNGPSIIDQSRASQRPAFLPGARINTGPVADGPFHVSPSIDPKHVEVLDNYEEFQGYLAPAHNALSTAVEGLKQIDDAWQQLRKDQSKTDQQKSLVIAPAAEKKQEAILRTFTTAQENLHKAVEQIEAELSKPIVAAATASASNAELRTVIRGMKPEERVVLIDKAVRDCDATVVNAVLGVHPLVTDIDPKRHQLWTRAWHELTHPELVGRLNATRAAIAVLERAAPIALSQVEQAMRMKFSEAAKLKRLADSSEAALAKLRGAAS